MPEDQNSQNKPSDQHEPDQHPAGERKVEEIAGHLDIELPKTKLPLAVKLIGLLMILGGLSVAGTLLTDVILGVSGLVFDFVRLGIGIVLAILGYGLIRRRLLALIGFGILAAIAGFFNPISLALTVPIFVYLFTARRYLRPGILGRFFSRTGA